MAGIIRALGEFDGLAGTGHLIFGERAQYLENRKSGSDTGKIKENTDSVGSEGKYGLQHFNSIRILGAARFKVSGILGREAPIDKPFVLDELHDRGVRERSGRIDASLPQTVSDANIKHGDNLQ